MSNIAIQGAATGTGVFTLASPATNTNRTLVLPDASGTIVTTATLPSIPNPLTLGTEVATTSGTAIDFTGIPSWVKKITLLMKAVSTNGGSDYIVRIGDTTLATSGYTSVANYVNPGANSCTGTAYYGGFILTKDINSGTAFTATCTITLQSPGLYVWAFIGNNGLSGAGFFGSSYLDLGSTLNRVTLTTLGGSDIFDAGAINIMYE